MRGKRTFAVFALAVVAATAANAFYGFSGSADDRSSWKESYIVATSPVHFTMRQPDGVLREFRRDLLEPQVLVGESPWVGEIDGPRTLVMTDPSFKGGRTGFLFVRGKLRRMLLDGREIEVEAGTGERDAAPVGTKRPEVSEDMVAAANALYGIHWKGRLSLWYRNPNAAGMLLVELALLALGLFCLRGRAAKVAGGVAFAVFACAVAFTGSRSAMLGLLAGTACLALPHARRLFTARNLLFVGAAVAVLCVAALCGGYAERFTTKMFVEGSSETSRLPIWAEVPRMVAAAPGGWGHGGSGVAYMNWFQPLGRNHAVLGLISTHFTWLAEFGWLARIAYMMAWFSLLTLLAVFAFRRGRSLAFAVWAAFFTASFFNTIGTEPTLWIVPVCTLAAPLAGRFWREGRACLFAIAAAAALTAACTAALAALGRPSPDGIPVRGSSGRVVVNGTAADTWIVDDGFALDGGYYGLLGKSMRIWYSGHRTSPPVGVVRSLGDVPADARVVAAAGRACEELLSGKAAFFAAHGKVEKVLFVSPSCAWRDCAPLADGEVDFLVLAGEYSLRAQEGPPPKWVKAMPGCSLYIPGWLKYVF